jgi:AraC-like DNA-binding protein
MKFSEQDRLIFKAFGSTIQHANCQREISMSEIARNAGMSRQLLHQSYYETIEELVDCLQLFLLSDFVHLHPSSGLSDIFLTKIYGQKYSWQILYGPLSDESWHSRLDNYLLSIHMNDSLAGKILRTLIIDWLMSDNLTDLEELQSTWRVCLAYLASTLD